MMDLGYNNLQDQLQGQLQNQLAQMQGRIQQMPPLPQSAEAPTTTQVTTHHHHAQVQTQAPVQTHHDGQIHQHQSDLAQAHQQAHKIPQVQLQPTVDQRRLREEPNVEVQAAVQSMLEDNNEHHKKRQRVMVETPATTATASHLAPQTTAYHPSQHLHPQNPPSSPTTNNNAMTVNLGPVPGITTANNPLTSNPPTANTDVYSLLTNDQNHIACRVMNFAVFFMFWAYEPHNIFTYFYVPHYFCPPSRTRCAHKNRTWDMPIAN